MIYNKRSVLVKFTVILLVFVMFVLSLSPLSVKAETATIFEMAYNISNTAPKVGEEIDFTFSLVNYNLHDANIRGLEINFGINPDLVEVVGTPSSLITDMLNSANYNATTKNVVFMYASFGSPAYLTKTTTDLLSFKIRIKDTVSTSGTITFPITYRFVVYSTNEKVTQTENCIINYSVPAPTLLGSGIRFTGDSGIRFGSSVAKDDFYKLHYTNDVYSYDAGSKISFGTLIIPSSLLSGDLTVNTAQVMNLPAQIIYSESANSLYFSGVIYGIPTSQYNTLLSARSYIEYTNSVGETSYLYSDTIERSYVGIAEAALETEKNPTIRSALQAIIDAAV